MHGWQGRWGRISLTTSRKGGIEQSAFFGDQDFEAYLVLCLNIKPKYGRIT